MMKLKTYTVDLDRPRVLRFERRYVREAEATALRETGQSLTGLLQAQAIFYVVQLLLWSGLRWEDRKMSRQAAERLMDQAADPDELAETVMEAFYHSGLFKADADEDAGDDEGNAQRAETAEAS